MRHEDIDPHQEKLQTARVTAPLLGMGLSSFYKMAKEGLIPSYRVGLRGSGLRFSIAEVKAALRQLRPRIQKPEEN